MPYPSRADYAEAVRDYPHISMLDPELKGGKPRRGTNNHLIVYSGGFSSVFPIEVLSSTYALRCWIKDIGDAETRYQEISDYLKQCRLPYFVDFAYVPEGILVNGIKYPITRMEWVEWAEGGTLCDFIKQNLQDARCLETAAAEFQKMVETLHTHQISHGDLQYGNILLKRNGTDVEIKLIDYDSLFVPALRGQPDSIVGLPEYQHPQRITGGGQANEKVDYFSELVIYLSFLSLAEKPDLWSQFGEQIEGGLLFTAEDFKNPDQSDVLRELENLSTDVKQLASKLKDFCAKPSINQLEPLEAVLPKTSPAHFLNRMLNLWQYTTGALAFGLVICIVAFAMQMSAKDEVLRRNRELQNQLTKRKTEIISLVNENQTLRNQLNQPAEQELRLKVAMVELRSQNQRLRNEKEKLRSQNQMLQNENTMLREQLDKLTQSDVKLTQSDVKQIRKVPGNRSNDQLRAAPPQEISNNSNPRVALVATAELRSQNQRLRNEKEKLRSQNQMLQNENTALREQLDKLTQSDVKLTQSDVKQIRKVPGNRSNDQLRAAPPQEISNNSSPRVRLVAMSKNNQGFITFNRNQHNKAIALFQDAIQSDPKSAVVHYNLGCTYLAMREYATARNSLRVAVALDPKFKEAYYNLALTWFRRGYRQEAIGAAQKALNIDKNYPPARQLLDAIE